MDCTENKKGDSSMDYYLHLVIQLYSEYLNSKWANFTTVNAER